MNRAAATAKINLGLVVGPRRNDGKHEVTTVLQRVALADRIELEPARATSVEGFAHDTLVRAALEQLAEAAGARAAWRARIDKRIPVAAGLGGGSSDAATALRLANTLLGEPLDPRRLHELAAGLGADVPFFLRSGPHLAEADGTELMQLELPQDYFVVLVLPTNATKQSTAEVYAQFDERAGAEGYEQRRAALLQAIEVTHRARDLAALPQNDLASSPVVDELRALGAFRADVSGAGPAVYGLFVHRERAEAAQRRVRALGRAWMTVPAWYG